MLFDGNTGDDITTAGAIVTCANPAYTSGLLSCSGCSGSYDIPLACTICSPSSTSSCAVCPEGTYGGVEAEIACQLCPVGYHRLPAEHNLLQQLCGHHQPADIGPDAEAHDHTDDGKRLYFASKTALIWSNRS